MLTRMPVPEAPLERTERGLVPDGDGWFVVNVADAIAVYSPRYGSAAVFEGEARFGEFGINVHVLEPGQPGCMYHREDGQEGFLVLDGECTLIVEDEVHRLVKGDFFHAAAGTAHVFVGAGDRRCAILMVGMRTPGMDILYPVSATAAHFGASVEEETADPAVAYAGTSESERGPLGEVPW